MNGLEGIWCAHVAFRRPGRPEGERELVELRAVAPGARLALLLAVASLEASHGTDCILLSVWAELEGLEGPAAGGFWRTHVEARERARQ